MSHFMTGVIRKAAALLLVAVVFVSDVAHAQTTVEYVHTDALGSPIAVTDQAGTVIDRNDYEPYGTVIGEPGYQGAGFTGHVQDAATMLTYMQQRYYDQNAGRFLSVDPVTAYENPVSGFNRYRYAVNNPYLFTDPDGRIDWKQLGDAFKLELAFGLSLEAKAKIGPAKVSLGVGGATFGGGVTAAPDAYYFQEVAGPSAAVEFGSYGMGWVGSSERSYQGRNGQSYSEESSPGGGVFGAKGAELTVEEGGGNGEISGSVGAVIVKATGSVDLGKAWNALTSPSGGSGSQGSSSSGGSGGGFQGTFRTSGRLESRRIDEEMDR